MEEHNERHKLTYKDQIKISILVILGFTIAMIGGAYAYFSATVTGDAVTNTVQAAILAGIDFEGGQSLVIPDSGIYPGWYGVQSVTINKPDGLTEGVGAYSLTMDPTVDPAYGDWVTYEVYKTTDSGKTITRVEGDVQVDADGKVYQTDDLTFVGFTETTDAFKKGIINSTTTKFEVDKQNYDMATFETVTYIFVYHFTNPDIDQNAAMGKSFSIEIDVEMINQFEVFPPVSDSITALVGNGEVFSENGIRYQGTNPNNYVVFEEGGEVYRIIGVFDTLLADGTTTDSLVKLIKEETIGNLAWDAESESDWNSSDLKSILNTNFLNSTEDYTANGLNAQKEMIANVTWNLGGTGSYLTAEGFYNAERGTTVYSGRPTTGTSSVGLMYPSDYMYAVKETDCARTTISSPDYSDTSTCHDNNWLYDGVNEWALTPDSTVSFAAWFVLSDGTVDVSNLLFEYDVRPTVYLNADTVLVSGTGSSIDPYVIG